MSTTTPTREQDHCTAHSDYRADCNPCFDVWLHNADIRTQGYEAVCNDIDAVLMGLSPFAAAWASAPESQKRYVEENDARYWFTCGQQASERATLKDLAEMNRLMREKGLA